MPLILLQQTRFEIREHLLEHHRTPEHEETPVENLTLPRNKKWDITPERGVTFSRTSTYR
jgi:hypothetical protein